MKTTLSESIQDYLKAIYELEHEHGAASTTALSEKLGVAPASVTGMLQRLGSVQHPLVIYHKHQGTILSPEGRLAALEVIRHHRLIESYLVQALGYSWDEVHEEACRLEHVISENFEARIAAALGDPERDPHGEPIPRADLSLPDDPSQPLSSLRPPQKGTILRVSAENPALLRHLESLGLVPGIKFSVHTFSEFDQNLHINVTGKDETLILGPAITTQIFVEVEPL
jgi:DtxR family Mn-dependent transcriptional regulator